MGTIQPVIDFLVRVAPLLAALGLFHLAAAGARAAWAKTKIAAAGTPTKVDDFLVHIADGPLTIALDLLDRGDLEGARKKIEALKSLVPPKGPQA